MSTIVPDAIDKQDDMPWRDDLDFWVNQLESARSDLKFAQSRVENFEEEIEDYVAQIERITQMRTERGDS